nr:heparan-alpha-glucosaminide N-acetyltransferase [uncultured Eisenbergiella sp.]
MSAKKVRTRYSLLDLVRGLTLLSMIAYHGAYDLSYLFHIKIPWFREEPGYLWQQSICWTFICLSGMCFCLGRRPVKRGLILSGCGLLITLATAVVMPDSLVIMGILSFFGLATLITAVLQPVLRRIPAFPGLAASFLLFLLTREISSGYLGFEGLRLAALPRFLYQGRLMMVLGFPYDGFYSTDYFPLFPWLFLFFTGYFIWKLLTAVNGAFTAMLSRPKCRPLELLGKYTLPVYMLHQPVLMAVFSVFDWIGVI